MLPNVTPMGRSLLGRVGQCVGGEASQMRAQQIGDGLGASKSGRAARWQLGVWWKGLSEPDRAAVWWWLGTFGVSVLTILGLGTHSGTGLKLYESQSSMIVGLSVGWLALAVISFATISATLARFSWKRWRREGRQGLSISMRSKYV